MNWKITIAACIMACTTFAQATNNSEIPFYPTTPGVVMNYETKDNKGQVTEQTKDSIAAFSGDIKNGLAIVITSNPNSAEKLDITLKKPMLFKEGEVILDLGSLMTNTMQVALQASLLQAGASESDMEEMNKAIENTKVEGECRGMPLHPTIGMKLPDYEVNLKILFMNSKIKCTDRKITGQETITTAAGTYNCYIIEETVDVSTPGVRQKNTTKSWYARGIGPVKEEIYEKKKLVSTTELISIL